MRSRQAWRSAIRCPARLPLSTVEMYAGSRTCRSCEVIPVVEVPAETGQRARGCRTPARAAGHLLEVEEARGRGRSPSRAAAGRCWSGEVRMRPPAPPGRTGQLSGASQCVSAPTNRSKNRQCSGRIVAPGRGSRRRSASPTVTGDASCVATTGESIQSRVSGQTANSSGRIPAAERSAGHDPPHRQPGDGHRDEALSPAGRDIAASVSAEVPAVARCDRAAVCHSSR